jgi:hypothetical protein
MADVLIERLSLSGGILEFVGESCHFRHRLQQGLIQTSTLLPN